MNIFDINITSLHIKPPKKYDESYLCKLKYIPNDLVKTKLVFNISKCVIQNIKGTTLYLKSNDSVVKQILRIEDAIVNITKDNVHSWFNHKLSPSSIEDMFVGSVVLHEKYGKLIKIRISNASCLSDLQNGMSGSIVLRMACVKFLKQSFNVVWEYESFQESKTDYMFNDEEDHGQDELDDEGFDDEVLCNIQSDLCGNVSKTIEVAKGHILKLETIIKDLEQVRTRLAGQKISVSELDDISQHVDAINVENIF